MSNNNMIPSVTAAAPAIRTNTSTSRRIARATRQPNEDAFVSRQEYVVLQNRILEIEAQFYERDSEDITGSMRRRNTQRNKHLNVGRPPVQ
jgi:hypothetical protein